MTLDVMLITSRGVQAITGVQLGRCLVGRGRKQKPAAKARLILVRNHRRCGYPTDEGEGFALAAHVATAFWDVDI